VQHRVAVGILRRRQRGHALTTPRRHLTSTSAITPTLRPRTFCPKIPPSDISIRPGDTLWPRMLGSLVGFGIPSVLRNAIEMASAAMHAW
jgi:hypothetical protein